ncbi:MAG: hypothetical protein OEV29_12750 [Thermoleophilia bacterium]|nr:hypothetical protein [Thermoleophilia bacterium]MDH4341370.1 hypothetical protein [Thermoleophilia bacterium]
MPSVKIDPEGGLPYGAPQIGSNQKQANEHQDIYLPGPDANTSLPGDPLSPKELPEKGSE